MKELTSIETTSVAGGSVAGVLVYGTIGFWVGGFTGFCMGGLPAIPGSILGMTIGAYLGTDSQPQVIYVVDNSPKF
jgi:hypothetical protein